MNSWCISRLLRSSTADVTLPTNLDLAHQAANDKALRTALHVPKDKKLHVAAFKQHGFGDKTAPAARKRSRSSSQPHT